MAGYPERRDPILYVEMTAFKRQVVLLGIFRAGTDEYEIRPDSRSRVEKRHANRRLEATLR
jgi:hypothetical protein